MHAHAQLQLQHMNFESGDRSPLVEDDRWHARARSVKIKF